MDNSNDADATRAAAAPNRFERYERASELPQVVASALFLTSYAWPILDQDMPPWLSQACVVGLFLAWAFFLADYVTRLVLSPSRGQFITNNPLSLLIVFVPLLSPMRLLRLVPFLRGDRISGVEQSRIAVYSLSAAVLVVFVGSLVVLNAERQDPRANIKNFGDAVWWAMETLTTVGFGDFYPVTLMGRVVATVLMVGGIGLLGIVTAGLAAWLVNLVRKTEEEARNAAVTHHLEHLRARLDELMPHLRGHGEGSEPRDPEEPQGPAAPADPPNRP